MPSQYSKLSKISETILEIQTGTCSKSVTLWPPLRTLYGRRRKKRRRSRRRRRRRSRRKKKKEEEAVTDSPQQGFSSHLSMSRAKPEHLRPHLLGGGLLQVRDRSLVPGPHEAEHCDQEDQRLHLPFWGTARVENYGKGLKQNETQSACAESTHKVTR